ncbi:MAG: PLAT/LH2 domain-containing protein [Bacillota bacterium]|nr:PLAT/LH2 domain-containing protein [Bacillota bacterium]
MEYIFPHEDGFSESMEKAHENIDPELKRKEEILSKLDLNSTDAWKEKAPLQPYQTDTYYFELPFEPLSIDGIDIYCNSEPRSIKQNSWDIQGMRLYAIEGELTADNYSLNSKVFNNDHYYVKLNGELILSMQEQNGNGGQILNWTVDSVYDFSTDRNADIPMLVSEGTPYETEYGKTIFRIDLADVYGGGVEKLNQPYGSKENLENADFPEVAAMDIHYKDVFGDTLVATLPVIQSIKWTIFEYYYEAYLSEDNKEASGNMVSVTDSFIFASLAQQGETVAFSCDLPDMESVSRVIFYSGSEASKKLGFSVASEENISFAGVSVYPGDSMVMEVKTNNAAGPLYSFTEDPLYYRAASIYTGENLLQDSKYDITLRKYEKGARLTPVNNLAETYLFELKADTIALATAPEDIKITIKYKTINGSSRESEPISVREAAKNYYGFWPANTEEYAYKSLMYTDGLKFIVELRDVDFFSGVTISSWRSENVDGSAETTNSDWQLKSIGVSRVDSVLPRTCSWRDTNFSTYASDRIYSRDVFSTEIFFLEESVLVQPGDVKEIDFSSSSVVDKEQINWNESKYSMTFEESCSDMGFRDKRETYDVEVKVAGDVVALDGNGDAGSKNQFYFQLEFQNGSSGYVLANQQLASDGFRTGYTESFTVNTNRDYGELVSVRIIPEDVSESSDIYDKLNIESINVRRSSDGSVCRQWIITDVGWVGIDYRDEGSSTSISGQKGRTEGEISRVYPVTYKSYCVNLQFNINTGSYESESGDDRANTNKFHGTMQAELWYTSSSGETKKMTFDVIEKMYQYANKEPVYIADSTGTLLSAVTADYMFRPNHTDRFILSVDDIVRINRLVLKVTSTDGGIWRIGNIAVQRILSEGILQISSRDEYIRTNEMEELCSNTTEDGQMITLALSSGVTQTQDIYFPENNEIKVDEEGLSWVSTVTREPESKNDELNIYVFPSATTRDEFELDVAAQYTDAYGRRWQTFAEGMQRTVIDNQLVYHVQGIGASNMSTLNNLTIQAYTLGPGGGILDAYIDHAIVQQVRSGVVLNSYYIPFKGVNVESSYTSEPVGNYYGSVSRSEQVVSLALGPNTEAANLLTENRDIAVTLHYTSSNESGAREYRSRNVFLTDNGQTSIKAGDILEFTFNESYIRDVTGITISAVGGIAADIEMASVGVYSTTSASVVQNASRKLEKWYSFGNGVLLENGSASLLPTEETVHPVELQFVVAEADSTIESGTNTPIAMTLVYEDIYGVTRQLYVSDIRNHVVSSGVPFETGSTTTVRMMIRNADSLRWISLEPYDEDPNSRAMLKLQSISALLGEGDYMQKTNRVMKENVILEEGAEDPYRISLANILVEYSARAINPETGEYDRQPRMVKSSLATEKLVTKSGGGAILENIDVVNSSEGFSVSAALLGSDEGLSEMDHLVSVSDDEVIFTAPVNAGATSQKYRITVSANETSDIYASVEVEVLPQNGGSPDVEESEQDLDADEESDNEDDPVDEVE